MEAILTFRNTHDAILGERLLDEAGIPVSVMPLPGAIRAGCGISLRVAPGHRTRAAEALKRGGTVAEGCYLSGSYRPFPLPVFTEALELRPGDVVSMVGCGGKTALLHRLAMENRHRPVLLSTTTKILPPPQEVLDDNAASSPLSHGVHLLGRPVGQKLGAVDSRLLAETIPADGLTLLEADGSRGLPFKGWADYEPVIHEATTLTVGLCTVGAVGQPVSAEIVHRPEAFCRLTGAVPGEPISLVHLAAMIGAPGGMFYQARGRRVLLINQVETAEVRVLAARLTALLPQTLEAVLAGSIRDGAVKTIGGS